jgi:hypothetical protein
MKLIGIGIAALAALAFWRRSDVKSGAARASKSAGDAASKVRTKLRPSATEDGEELADMDRDTAVDEDAAKHAEPALAVTD